MRNYRQFVGAFVMAVTVAALLGTASPVSADAGAPGGAQRSTCAFLQGILYKIGNAGAAERIANIFENLFGCDFAPIG
jgi:hypothetical protein